MRSASWLTVGIVLALGGVTVWYSIALQQYNMTGLQPRDVEWKLVGLAALPTALFIGASLLRRRALLMQGIVLLTALSTGALRLLAMNDELTTEWSRAKGAFSGVVWLGSAVVAALVVLGAFIWWIVDRVHEQNALALASRERQ